MVLTRSAAKQPSPGHRERPPKAKRTKQPASSSSKSSKASSSKPKKGLQKVVQNLNHDRVLEENEEEEELIVVPTQSKSKQKKGLRLKKEDCKNFASIMSQPLFDQEEAVELHALFTEFQDALQSRVNTISRTRSGNNSIVAVSQTPLMQKFFAKCPKTRVKVITRPSPIQEESLEVSNAILQSSKTNTSHADGAHAERKRKNGKKKKLSYLLPPKSPLNKRVTRSRAKKDQKGHKNGLLNVTSSTDASVKDGPYRKDSSSSTTASVITNDTGIFSQTQTQSTYQSTPMKSNRKQSDVKKVVLDLVPTTMNSSKKSSSSSSTTSSTTTSKEDNDELFITDSTTTNLPPTGKKRQRMESEAIGVFEFNAIQDVQSSKRRLMTHEKENVNVNLIESIKKKNPIVIVERLPKSEIAGRTLQQQQQQQNNNNINMNFQEIQHNNNINSKSSSIKTNNNINLITKTTLPATTSSITNTNTTTRQNSSCSITALSTPSTNSNSSTKTTTTTTDSMMNVAKNKDNLKSVASKKSTSDENKECQTTTIITTTSRNKSKGTIQDKKKISQEQQQQYKEIPEKDQKCRVSSSKEPLIEKTSKTETTTTTTKSIKKSSNLPTTPVANKTTELINPLSSTKCFDKTYVKPSTKNNDTNGNPDDDEFILPLALNTTHVIKHSTTKTTTTGMNYQHTIPTIDTPPATLSSHQSFGNVNQTYVVTNLVSSDPNQTYVKPVFDQTFDVSIPSKKISTTTTTTNTTNYMPPNLSTPSSSTIILPNEKNSNKISTTKITTRPTSSTTTTNNNNNIAPVIEKIQITQEQDKSNKKVEDGQKGFNNNIINKPGENGTKISSNIQGLTPKFNKFPSASSLSSNSSSSSYSSVNSQKPRDKVDNANRARPSKEKPKKPNSESAVHPQKVILVPKPITVDRQDVCAQKKKEIDEQKKEAQRKKNEEWKLKVEKKKQAEAEEAEEKARREKEKQALDAKKALVINTGKKYDKIKYPMNPPLPNPLKLGTLLKSKYTGGLVTGGSCPDISKKLQQAKVPTKLGLQNAASTGTLPTSSENLGGGPSKTNCNSNKQIGDNMGSATNWKPISKTAPIVNDNVGPSYKQTTEPMRPKSPVKIQPIQIQKLQQQQQLPPPPPPPATIYPTREPEPIPQEDSFYSVAESTFISQYEITLYQDLDEDLRHRENKPIPNWAKDPEILHKSLFFQQPDLINCMTRSCFPQKNVGYQIFPNRGINMRK